MKARRREQPWWVDGGSQICPLCHQLYVLEMERRCASCDIAICVFCAVTGHAGEVSCSDCHQPALQE